MHMLSTFVIKNAKLIVGIWALFFAIMVIFALQLPNKLQGDGFFVDDDHIRVTEELSEKFDLPAKTIFVLFEGKSNSEISRILTKLEQEIEDIQKVTSPVATDSLQKDGISYAMLDFDKGVENYSAIVDDIREVLKSESDVSITGEPVISKDINLASQKDLMQAEAIGVPIAMVVLLLAFGTVVSALLPIIVGVATVISCFGILALLGDTVNLSIFILNIVPMLGLALSIDFALLLINRYREERERVSIEESVKIAIQTAGRSIIFSAVCVMIGLGAMVIIQVEIFQNIALGGTIVVFLAVLSGLTLLPASILLLGDRLNKWRILRVKTSASRWQRFAAFVMKRPVMIIFAALILLGIAMIPIKDIQLTIPSTDALPTSFEARQTYDKLSDTFELGEEASVFLLAERPNGWDDTAGLEQLMHIQQRLENDSLVTNVNSLFTAAQIDSVETWKIALANPQMATSLDLVHDAFIQDEQMYIQFFIDAEGSSSEAQSFVRDLMDEDLGVDFALGGQPKFNQEIFDEIASKIVLALTIIISTTFVILMLAFRSILIPLKAIIMNIIGLGATFGILVYIFQYGHFGLEAGTIVLIIPVIVFCLVFGLSMDYEVFLISRIQEEYLNGSNNTKATIDGLVSTSKIITSAALIMIVITGAFAFTNVVAVKQIGVGIAIAVAIDATIIRLMLVPSLMKLFGDWNWWLPFKKGR